MQVTCGTMGLSTTTVKLVSIDGNTRVACSIGTGPVDSAYKAINLIVKVIGSSISACLISIYLVDFESFSRLNLASMYKHLSLSMDWYHVYPITI